MKTVYRAKAPLRLGLGGGGTDLAAYASQFGGAIINATISMYARVSIEPLDGKQIEFISPDRGMSAQIPRAEQLELPKDFALHCGVFNRLVRDYHIPATPFRLTTSVDAAPGSGLGSSSTLVVAIIAAFAEWHRLPLGDYEIAQLAYEIERIDLGMAGGKQDQFAATFGGFNFMEFLKDDSVLVNPLRMRQNLVSELEHQCVLIHTKTSRYSSDIINEQIKSVTAAGGQGKMDALHQVKNSAYIIKKALLTGDFVALGQALHESWLQKKRSAAHISTPQIDSLYETAQKAGAIGGKISGAGGGGYMFLICSGDNRYAVIDALKKTDAEVVPFSFTPQGVLSWRI